MFSDTILKKFELEIHKFPLGKQQSAVIACLAIIQEDQGYISQESERSLAHILKMSPVLVHEVATFYNMFNLAEVGKYKISICTNLSCQLKGAQELYHLVVDYLQSHQQTRNLVDLFCVQQSECLGACADAPVLLVNDRYMCSYMDEPKVKSLIDNLAVEVDKP
ncbi:MAG: NADH-quinone oxidoreductase subunit NuoE [Gammaproteobacteria bacterium]|nr:NADH-quinone oxidoreductase subunit NuoE [Gammaproteobacteria bacterium]